jgi:hypothetical protein
MSAAELDKKVGEVNELFVEARELIADALDSQGSTYFEDDLDVSARYCVKCDVLTFARPLLPAPHPPSLTVHALTRMPRLL